MRWLATLIVLVSRAVASGQNYTFGDWARDQGYLPPDYDQFVKDVIKEIQ